MHDQGGSCIAVDAMGSDMGPGEIVAAVKLALAAIPDLRPIVLVGDEALLRPALAHEGLERDARVSILHASEVIEMDDKPLAALKRKKDSSMVRGIELLKDGKAKCLVSCGNTGSLMAGGTLKLRTLDGVERPALATIMPRQRSHFVLLDAGANPLAKPEHLVHNAVLGNNFCKIALGIEKPTVGLMSIGTEEGKGSDLINQAHALLKRIPHVLDYRGPIEGFQLFEESVDVVVCDGFTGNVVLKASESLFMLLKRFASEELKRNPLRKLGALLSMGAFKAIKTQLNPDRYGGAPLLGLRGNILKAHGSSNRHAVLSAIRTANQIVSKDLTGRIVEDIERTNSAIYETPV